MKTDYLKSLSVVIERLLSDPSIKETIKVLKMELQRSREPFVWRTINIKPVRDDLPKNIRSAWIFVLRKNAPSVAHYHPNSAQYTVVIEGKGKAIIGGAHKELKLFDAQNEKKWLVIGKDTPHEFFPEEQDMAVISFHTCLDDELIEIEADSGRQRLYRRSQG
jgi:quercetin dioxygenase-like cupin family protein